MLVGDALLNGALRLVTERLDAAPEVRLAVVGEITRGVAGMVDGQYLDVTADGMPDHGQLARIHRLKTGALIEASTVCGALVAGAHDVAPYRALGAELGLLFQIVDDILDEGSDDEPSFVNTLGLEQSRELAGESHRRAEALLAELPGDRSELDGLVEQIALRTA